MTRHFRLGMRDGAMAAVGFWLGLVALSNGVDLYLRTLRLQRSAVERRRGFRA